jgi:hypothetical protein
MRMRGPALLVALCVASATSEEPPCGHPASGESRAVSLEQVGKAQEELRKKLTLAWDKGLRLGPEPSFDSGLPACRSRQVRRLRTTLPREWVGRTIAFSPPDRMPPADVSVATSARRLADLRADALADPRLLERLGVRCAPTLVRALSEVELELVENP